MVQNVSEAKVRTPPATQTRPDGADGSPAEAPERALLDAGYRYAMSLRAHPHDAEDLVQEAWFRLLRRYRVVRDKPLLFRTIRNLFVDQYRRERLVLIESLDEATLNRAVADMPPLDAALQARDLEVPLSRLRPEEREALYLSTVEGYTASEIAALTGRPRGTVLSLTHRARLKLRKLLDGWQSE